MRHINERGIEMVKSFEGLALSSYTCAGGVNSVGYGSTVSRTGGPFNLDMEPQLVKLKRKLYSYVTWRVPKDGFVGLLKRAFRQIDIPL
jgi:GH24 family phage-related lysozyme (muramidase)